MKKIILVLLLLLLTTQAYGWWVEIYTPRSCMTMPTPIIVNSLPHTWQVQFKIHEGFPVLYQYHYWIYYVQNGQETQVVSQTLAEPNEIITKNVDIGAQNGPFPNQLCNLKIKVHRINTSEWEQGNAFFVAYASNGIPPWGTDLRVATNGSSAWQNTTNVFYYKGNPCGIANGIHNSDRYKITFTISKSANESVELVTANSMGFNGANPNSQWMWYYKVSQTSTTATLATFVYYLRDELMWWPCHYDDAAVVYKLNTQTSPVITGFVQSPLPIIQGNSGTVTCNASGTQPITYSWTWENTWNGYTVTPNGNVVSITYGSDFSESPDVELFKLTCTATNGNGSDIESFFPVKSYISGGCPWIAVMTEDSSYELDNNILHKSQFPEYEDGDIFDNYVLNVTPGIIDSTISIALYEMGEEFSLFDKVRLIAVDHPVGTKIGITEDNVLVMLDSEVVQSTVYATLTDPYENTTEITDDIQFHYETKIFVGGEKFYTTFAEYENNTYDNLAIILKTQNDWNGNPYPSTKTDYAGSLTAYTGDGEIQTSFAKRENSSIQIIPLCGPGEENSLESLNIEWGKYFKNKYIALASLLYDDGESDITVTELSLTEAIHSEYGDIKSSLTTVDQLYCGLSSDSYVDLKFENVNGPSPYYVRDYIFVVNGRIVDLSEEDHMIQLSNQSSITKESKLNDNYPNPFNPITKISFTIDKTGLTKLMVYDILGRQIKVLVNEVKNPGYYTVEFNGSDLPSGVYFYKIETDDFSAVKKMVLIK